MMKFTVLATLASTASAFAPMQSASRSTALDAGIVDTLNSLQGPGQVWGADGIEQGFEESDLRGYDNFGKFTALLQSTGVAGTLQGPGPYTVFAPTDTAIATYETMFGVVDANVLNYCIVNGNVASSGLGSADLTNLSGGSLVYGRRFRKDFVDESIIGEKTFGMFADFPTDVACDNGVIHSIGIMLKPN